MAEMKYVILGFVFFCMSMAYSQTTTITYEANDTTGLNMASNPFQKFIGEWTLKENRWTQNWGGETETIRIPGHHTISTQINTTNSLFSIIDGPAPNGHIFWSYNPVTKRVNHLSSFGELRAGVGGGSINGDGDVTLKIAFEGEPEGTYRIYKYSWVTKDEYHMKSVQYDINDKQTGLFYEGVFVRLPKVEKLSLGAQIEAVLAVLDNNDISIEEQLEAYIEDVAHMPPGGELNIGKEALRSFLKEQRKHGETVMKHEILEVEQHGNIVIMRGQVTGNYYPKNGAPSMPFRTKNLFVLQSMGGGLKIKKVIYNSSPLE